MYYPESMDDVLLHFEEDREGEPVHHRPTQVAMYHRIDTRILADSLKDLRERGLESRVDVRSLIGIPIPDPMKILSRPPE